MMYVGILCKHFIFSLHNSSYNVDVGELERKGKNREKQEKRGKKSVGSRWYATATDTIVISFIISLALLWHSVVLTRITVSIHSCLIDMIVSDRSI